MAQFDRKRYRRVQKTSTFAASGSDTISLQGPFNEVYGTLRGTTDNHTLDGAGMGILRSIREFNIRSSKRGLLGSLDGMTLYALSKMLFNSPTAVDTVGGLATDGFDFILPLGCDADELITIGIEWGSLADMCSTADLAGYTGVLRLTVGLLPHNPRTYWAYRKQAIGASGVIGVAGVYQQPPPEVLVGFHCTGELLLTATTALTTAMSEALSQMRVVQGDDTLVDDFIINLKLASLRKIYQNANINGYHLQRHIPIQNNDAFQVTLTNGATATILPSEMLYIYQAGLLNAELGVIRDAPQVQQQSKTAGTAMAAPTYRDSTSPVKRKAFQKFGPVSK